MKSKCVVCDKKDAKTYITVDSWIIDHKGDAKLGKPYNIHTSCVSNILKYEPKEGFIYGRIK